MNGALTCFISQILINNKTKFGVVELDNDMKDKYHLIVEVWHPKENKDKSQIRVSLHEVTNESESTRDVPKGYH